MKRLLIGVAAAISLSTITSFASPLTGPIYNSDTGHYYYLLAPSTWTEAEAEALSLGGTLATVNNAQEESWIYSTFSDYGSQSRNLWIGLTSGEASGAEPGNYFWVSGETSTYSNWIYNQPMESEEHYTEITGPESSYGTSMWNNIADVSSDGYAGSSLKPIDGVVEVVPEPGSATIGAFGLLLAALVRSCRGTAIRRQQKA